MKATLMIWGVLQIWQFSEDNQNIFREKKSPQLDQFQFDGAKPQGLTSKH